MMDDDFCPVVLRKATVYGWSPRMRFDLVVNTFLKDALTRGRITIHYGGEMWRPLVDVRDVARAYIACLEADEVKVRGQIFNVIFRNMRISELALRVKETLAEQGIKIEIVPAYSYQGVRNYRVSARKIASVLDFHPVVDIEESVTNALEKLRGMSFSEFEDPRYYNIRWLKLLEEAEKVLDAPGALFGIPGRSERRGTGAAPARGELNAARPVACRIGSRAARDPVVRRNAAWKRARPSASGGTIRSTAARPNRRRSSGASSIRLVSKPSRNSRRKGR